MTTIERTLIDQAPHLDNRQLERAVVAADRSGRLRWARLRELLRRHDGRPGVARLRWVAAEADPDSSHTRSGIEIDFLALCRDAELPKPHVNALVGGAMVDFLWPAERLVVEVDSYRYHYDRPAFNRDHRSTVMLEAAGYAVHRITDEMLAAEPGPFLALVRASLRGRSHLDGRSRPQVPSGDSSSPQSRESRSPRNRGTT